MTHSTPKRRALVDLPINTFGTPSRTDITGKGAMSLKRSINDVAEPEASLSPSRVKRTSPSQSLSTDENRSIETSFTMLSQTIPPSRPIIPNAAVTHTEPVEEVEDEDSQQSCTEIDPDDTLVSQQTAATELTEPVQSRVSQHAERLRLGLRLAHFKVKTNQTHLPLSQLRTSTTEDQETPPVQEPSLPQLLPAPVLRPTAYSSRKISYSQIPSSPPSSPETACEKNEDDVFRTPAIPRHQTEPRQMSSTPDSPEGIPREKRVKEDRLTSSAV